MPTIAWTHLRFGVEIEFVGAPRGRLELLPGWTLAVEDDLYLEDGTRVIGDHPETPGAELASPKLTWAGRGQIREMCRRLAAIGARANFSCGLHVHADAAPWGGPAAVPAILKAALATEEALRTLLQTAPHRRRTAPPTLPHMLAEAGYPSYGERPASRRGAINARALWDHGSVELRLPNGTIHPDEIEATVALWLKWMIAACAGHPLPGTPEALAAALDAPIFGYPPPVPAPPWRSRELWLDETLYPALLPLCRDWAHGRYPESEEPLGITWIEAAPGGGVWAETETGSAADHLRFQWQDGGWRLVEIKKPESEQPALDGVGGEGGA